MNYTFLHGSIYTPTGSGEYNYWPSGGLVINDAGAIEAIGAWSDIEAQFCPHPSNVRYYDATHLLVPGLVDCHTHLPQFNAIGCQAPDLLSWLETHIFAEESRFSDLNYARTVSEQFFQNLRRHGTTTAAVFLTSNAQACQVAFCVAEKNLAQHRGVRLLMGQTLMDRNAPLELARPAAQLLEETEALCKRWHNTSAGLLQYAWTPRFAISCTQPLLSGVGELCKRYPDVLLQTHLAEQPAEIAETLKLFPNARHYTDVYAQVGMLTPKSIFAHGIHLSDEECRCLQGSRSSLAHCPGSNFFLKSGRFDWQRVQSHGLSFGLGSDVAAGPSLSLLNAMRDAQFTQESFLLDVHALWYRSTLGGAEALRISEVTGSLEPGKSADFIVLKAPNLPNSPTIHSPPLDTFLSQAIYSGDDRWVAETWLAGKKAPPCL